MTSCSCGFDNGECGCVILSQSEKPSQYVVCHEHGDHCGGAHCCCIDKHIYNIEQPTPAIGSDERADQSRRMANALERIAWALQAAGEIVDATEYEAIAGIVGRYIGKAELWDRQGRCVP